MKSSFIKFLTISCVGGLLSTGALLADDSTATPPPPPPAHGGPGGGRMDPAKRLEMLTTELSLTDAQKPQVKALIDAESESMKTLMADKSVAKEDRRTKMQAIHADFVTKMKAILTADQATKFDAIQAKLQERGPGKKKGGE